mmetsp:Transcript_114934/g.330048  ORF Transcript_114934/g.330048 Transcript_114934/m.330048 type:complete len:215 (+) Transcript_114934:1787-2431(+)
MPRTKTMHVMIGSLSRRDNATPTKVTVHVMHRSAGYNIVIMIKSFCAWPQPRDIKPRTKWAPCQKNKVNLNIVTICAHFSASRRARKLKPECFKTSGRCMHKLADNIHTLQPMTRTLSIKKCLKPIKCCTTPMPAGLTNQSSSRRIDVGTRRNITNVCRTRSVQPRRPRDNAMCQVGKKPVHAWNHCIIAKKITKRVFRLRRPSGSKKPPSWHM